MPQPRICAATLLFFLATGCEFVGSADDNSPVSEPDNSADGDQSAPSSDFGQVDVSVPRTPDVPDAPDSSDPSCQALSKSMMTFYSSPEATLETFEAARAGAGTACVCGELSSVTSSKCASPGDIAEGVLIVDDSDEAAIFGDEFISGPNGLTVGAADVGRTLAITFTDDRTRIGFDMHGDVSGRALVRYIDSEDRLLVSREVRLGSPLGNQANDANYGYVGFACEHPVARIEIEPVGDDLMVLLDDLVFE